MFNIRVMRFVYIEIVSMSGLPTKSYTIFFRNSLIMLIGWQWLCRYWKKTNNQSNPFRSVKVTTCHTHQANDARLREIPHMVCSGWWFGTFFPYIGNNNPNRLSYFSEGLKPPTIRSWCLHWPIIMAYMDSQRMMIFRSVRLPVSPMNFGTLTGEY